MRKVILVVMMMLIVVGCGSKEVEEVGKYEYKESGVTFKKDTEELRSFFEKNLDDESMVNIALGIYETGDYVAWRGSDEEDIAQDINTLRSYYVNNDYEVTNVKMLYAYAYYNDESRDEIGRECENAIKFIEFMESHEYSYNSKNINKYKYSRFQTLVNDKDKEKNKDFYKEYVINVLKTMNK